jgi:aspartyl-tRNA(Asn)/glutamyl-tRNA(Gln) amidotransferase subunit C
LFYFVYMEVTNEMIDHLAKLARLEFSAEEKTELKTDLQKMISFVDKLQEVDTTGVEPLTHMGSAMNALREDDIGGMIGKEEALLNAPVKDADFFKVPKVITQQ